jgi:hypothetical protein
MNVMGTYDWELDDSLTKEEILQHIRNEGLPRVQVGLGPNALGVTIQAGGDGNSFADLRVSRDGVLLTD